MPKGKSYFVIRNVEAFSPPFFLKHGRMPTIDECLKEFPQLANHRDAIRKALVTVHGRMSPEVKDAGSRASSLVPPTAKDEELHVEETKADTLSQRLELTRFALRKLYESSRRGVVDALGIDRLERLIRQQEVWLEKDAESSRMAALKKEGPPVWSTLLQDYEARALDGDNKPKGRGIVLDGVAKAE